MIEVYVLRVWLTEGGECELLAAAEDPELLYELAPDLIADSFPCDDGPGDGTFYWDVRHVAMVT